MMGTVHGGAQRATRLDRTERAERIWQLAAQGWTQAQIAADPLVNVGRARVGQILAELVETKREQIASGLAELRIARTAEALAKLDAAEAKIWELIERRHYVVNAGAVVLVPVLDEHGNLVPITGDDGTQLVDPDTGEPMHQYRQPMLDDGPIIAAINGPLDKIWKRRAALLGLDAPTEVRQQVTATYHYTVNGVDPEDLK